MNMYRTHNCNELNMKNVGETVKIAGWIQKSRNLGGLLFLDIRDQYGITQVVTVDEELSNKVAKIPTESVISVEGKVRERESKNKNIPTGDIEIVIEKYEVLGKRMKDLPFEINDVQDVREDLRLEYRFLSLRNERIKNNILLRAKVLRFIRNQMADMGFTEVQTPILTSSSPEGARDYLVPSRVHPGKFYALPQAPQQFKQLLMVSGIDKYFQIAPCFRDEDARADRAPGEFYQLDVEMAFATQEDVFKVVEEVVYKTFKEFSNKKISEYPFERITYRDSMLKYGSDKPDLRNPLVIKDITEIFKNTEFNAFKGQTIRAIVVHDANNISRKFYDAMGEFAKTECEAKGLAWIKVLENNELQGSVAKFLSEEEKEELLKKLELKENDAIFLIADEEQKAALIAGKIRTELGIKLDLLEKDTFKFCWIVDFPMYELDEEGNIAFSHNPFSMPQGGLEALRNKKPLEIYAYQYDLVCNGVELSSGAVRNHDPEIMVKAFEIAGYTKEHIEKKFPALFHAFHYGAPPHAGIAPGLDRMIMLITDEPNIREVIAFPMNSKAQDLLMGAPGEVTEKQLKEIHIKITEKPKND